MIAICTFTTNNRHPRMSGIKITAGHFSKFIQITTCRYSRSSISPQIHHYGHKRYSRRQKVPGSMFVECHFYTHTISISYPLYNTCKEEAISTLQCLHMPKLVLSKQMYNLGTVYYNESHQQLYTIAFN